jgi:cell division septum initiation protein DivIVA
MEVLDINRLVERRTQLLSWIDDVDASVPELVMDIKFWREEIEEINQKIEHLENETDS